MPERAIPSDDERRRPRSLPSSSAARPLPCRSGAETTASERWPSTTAFTWRPSTTCPVSPSRTVSGAPPEFPPPRATRLPALPGTRCRGLRFQSGLTGAARNGEDVGRRVVRRRAAVVHTAREDDRAVGTATCQRAQPPRGRRCGRGRSGREQVVAAVIADVRRGRPAAGPPAVRPVAVALEAS